MKDTNELIFTPEQYDIVNKIGRNTGLYIHEYMALISATKEYKQVLLDTVDACNKSRNAFNMLMSIVYDVANTVKPEEFTFDEGVTTFGCEEQK